MAAKQWAGWLSSGVLAGFQTAGWLTAKLSAGACGAAADKNLLGERVLPYMCRTGPSKSENGRKLIYAPH